MGDNGKRATYTTTVRVRMTPEMYYEITHIAGTLDANPSEVIRSAIKHYLKEYNNCKNVLRKLEEFTKDIG